MGGQGHGSDGHDGHGRHEHRRHLCGGHGYGGHSRGPQTPGRVLLLGGSGAYGRDIAGLLAAAPDVSRLTIAGRDIDAARGLADALGAKASAARLDLSRPGELSGPAADADLVVNAAGPERSVVLPALRRAIAAGVDYCDLCADAVVTAEARRLDREAVKAGVTAVLGAGEFPGLSNLTMLRAAQALDVADEVRHCVVYAPCREEETPADTLRRWRDLGRVEASWQLIMGAFAPPVRVVRDGRLVEVSPAEESTVLTTPAGDPVTAYPVGFPEPLTLHEALPETGAIAAYWSFAPDALNKRALELGGAITRGELRESQAVVDFLGLVDSPAPASPVPPPHLRLPFVYWAEATGQKHGRRAVARCAARGGWATTAALLCAAALRILRGDIPQHGVLSPESCLEPLPYVAEAARLAGVTSPATPLLEESVQARE